MLIRAAPFSCKYFYYYYYLFHLCKAQFIHSRRCMYQGPSAGPEPLVGFGGGEKKEKVTDEERKLI